jgi:hypothetical protein
MEQSGFKQRDFLDIDDRRRRHDLGYVAGFVF